MATYYKIRNCAFENNINKPTFPLGVKENLLILVHRASVEINKYNIICPRQMYIKVLDRFVIYKSVYYG